MDEIGVPGILEELELSGLNNRGLGKSAARGDMRKGFRFGSGHSVILALALAFFVSEAVGKVSMRDDLGAMVELERYPSRIISLSPSNTEILFAIGAGDRVVGVTSFCDYPSEAKTKEIIGGYTNPNLERIVSLRPDLVLAAKGNPKTVVAKLRNLGIPVFAVDSRGVRDLIGDIRRIGSLVGERERADSLCSGLMRRIDRITDKTSAIPPERRPRVFWGGWKTPIFTAGPGSFVHELIEMAGGGNIAGDSKVPWPNFSLEAVIERDPEIIIVGEMTPGNPLRLFESAEGWKEVSAVKQGRIYYIDPNILTRPGPRLVDALELMAKIIHPELFNRDERR